MWQRFTERARRVVFYAQEESRRFGQAYVSVEHLLLGLCRESDSTAAMALTSLGVSLAQIRQRVEQTMPAADNTPTQDMTLTPQAKRVIDLAYEEARDLNNNYIGTEHLLLGLLREGEGLAARALIALGMNLKDLREAVVSHQAASDPGPRGASSSAGSGLGRLEHSFLLARMNFIRREGYRLEFLALLLLSDESDEIDKFLGALLANRMELRNEIESKFFDSIYKVGLSKLAFDLPSILQMACEEAEMSNKPLGPQHILTAIVRAGDNVVADYLATRNVDLERMRIALKGSSTS